MFTLYVTDTPGGSHVGRTGTIAAPCCQVVYLLFLCRLATALSGLCALGLLWNFAKETSLRNFFGTSTAPLIPFFGELRWCFLPCSLGTLCFHAGAAS